MKKVKAEVLSPVELEKRNLNSSIKQMERSVDLGIIPLNPTRHFKVIEGISTISSLEKQQKCDKIKKEYCLSQNINLLEIPYWEYDSINDILKKQLK